MPRATIHVNGKTSLWGVDWHASQEQIDAMRADGVEVFILENVIPSWVVDSGLTRTWCFFQDIWNFKNPWRD